MKSIVDIVSFGKYKGQSLDVLRSDPAYCEWLTAQSWFREKHEAVYQLIINNFIEPTNTPEHNRLQVKFLDRDLWLHLLGNLGWEPLSDKQNLIKKMHQKIDEINHKISTNNKNEWSKHQFEDWEWQIKDYNNFILHLPNMKDDEIEINYEFEHCGWDVVVTAKLPLFAKNMGDYFSLKHLYQVTCAVELKPEVSDDYPAILRQMKASERAFKADFGVLVFDNFTAEGASLAQVKQIFSSSGFNVLSLSDIKKVPSTGVQG